MFELEVLALFFTSSLLLALAPGPDNIFVLTTAMQKGPIAGIFITLGLCTGLLFHTAAVTLGIASLFASSSLAFSLLKYIGAAYLLFLAWKAFHAKATITSESSLVDVDLRKLYRRGIIMNITNPKVSLFFLAFLPQFADVSRGNMTGQLILLGIIFILAALLVFGAISLLAGSVGDQLRQSKSIQTWLNRLAGTIFAGLAIKLALSEH